MTTQNPQEMSQRLAFPFHEWHLGLMLKNKFCVEHTLGEI